MAENPLRLCPPSDDPWTILLPSEREDDDQVLIPVTPSLIIQPVALLAPWHICPSFDHDHSLPALSLSRADDSLAGLAGHVP
jgi:hypothetical protein